MQQISLTTSDNLELNLVHWDLKKPSEVMILLHGLGGHSGKYKDVANFFWNQNMAVITPDLRGHGRSQGKRGHIPDYDQVMNDMERIFQKVNKLYPEKTPYLMGHSYGGNLALNFVLRSNPKVSKLVLTSPWLRLALDKRGVKAALLQAYNKVAFWSDERIRPKASLVTQDEQMHKKYRNDPLIHSEVSTSLLYHAIAAARWAMANAEKIQLPVLIMHGTDDPITDHRYSKQLAEKMGDNATLRLWEGLLHELLHEKNKEEVWQYVLDWLQE